jgi:hypothetical protein
MSTVNFSIPGAVRQAFDAAFAGRNKSAIVAQLMREAVDRDESDRASRAAVERILERRATAPRRTDTQLRKALLQGRP